VTLGRAAALVTIALAALGAACGGSSADSEGAVGVSTAQAAQAPIELALRTSQGTFVDVGDLRGKPVVLFLFATFDGMSQAALRPLSRFYRQHPEVHVIGIAVQPNPQMLLDPYVSALAVPFTVTYDPEERILPGTSMLGRVRVVPTYIVLDAHGFIRARHQGFASESKLERLLYDATHARR